MIPLPPRDAALGGLDKALNEEAMGDLLARRLPDCASGALRLESCRPLYVRYKPGTSCLVQYELALRNEEETSSSRTFAHAWLFPDGRAERIWAGRSLHRLVERAARRQPGPPAGRAAFLPELGALVQVYPVDLKLPGLVRAASGRKMRRALLEALPEGTAPALRKRRTELVRYKPARKALFRYRLRGGDLETVYAKLYADERGARLLGAGRALVAAGVAAPMPLAYLPQLRLLVLAEAPGRRLADLREARRFDEWLKPVAAALARLHATRDAGLPLAPPRNEAEGVLAAARTIGTLRPDLAARSAGLATRLAGRLAAAETSPAPVHGDFYDDQVLVSHAGVVLLDLDEARWGNPLLDVGNFLAHLSARGAEPSRGVFLDAYAAARPQARENALLFEAAALLRLAVGPFRRLEPGWPAELERRVELAGRRLEEHRRSARRPPSATDPGLPQLELLRDPARVARELERLVYKEPLEVTAAAILRHKPGRRCTLRYDVRPGRDGAGRSERLYAKTFASERGGRLYASLRALAAARACGPDVALPEPVGYVHGLRLVLQREAPGVPIRPSLLRGDERLAGFIAEALRALHCSGVRLERLHDLRGELDPLQGRVKRLSASSPSLAPLARRCLELGERGAERPWPWRWRPVHRDFYHDQILTGEHGLSVLDFDDAAMSEPAVDVANFLAHLRLLGHERPKAPEALAGVAAAFEGRYRELDPELDPALLRFLEGATLLRLAEIHLPREEGKRLAGRLLEESERLLRP